MKKIDLSIGFASLLSFGTLLFGFWGCGEKTDSIDWVLLFDPPELASSAAAIEATILSGGCEGSEEVYSSIFALDNQGIVPPSLESGTFGFYAVALNSECQPIARGCTNLTLPSEDTNRLVVTLRSYDGPRACPRNECENGICEGANFPDADSPHVDADTPVEDTDTPVEDADTPVEDADTPVEDADTPVEDADTPVEDADTVHDADPDIDAPDSDTLIQMVCEFLDDESTTSFIPVTFKTALRVHESYIKNVVIPDSTISATLSFLTFDAEHPEEEGTISVNGNDPIDLPAAPENDEAEAPASIPVTDDVVPGTNTIIFTHGEVYTDDTYEIKNVAIEVEALWDGCP